MFRLDLFCFSNWNEWILKAFLRNKVFIFYFIWFSCILLHHLIPENISLLFLKYINIHYIIICKKKKSSLMTRQTGVSAILNVWDLPIVPKHNLCDLLMSCFLWQGRISKAWQYVSGTVMICVFVFSRQWMAAVSCRDTNPEISTRHTHMHKNPQMFNWRSQHSLI